MFFLYLLLREIPTETSDPNTKERYAGLPLLLHVSFEVTRTVVELVASLILVDLLAEFLAGSLFFGGCTGGCVGGASSSSLLSVELKECLAEYVLGFCCVVVPGICVLIMGLLYSGLLVET
mmetsp:Transcript_43452/g.74159  ORF Transcript_43452/g.74159 Transcript_43452/m.74159 type:complete len:121 (+) Transcript_43452:337-699(+)